MTGLSSEQLKQFKEQGCLVIENFFTMSSVEEMMKRASELLKECSLDNHPMTRFTTDDSKHTGDEYFLASSEKVGYFFEEDAFYEDGTLKAPLSQSINKIGHYLHKLDPVFEKHSHNNKVVGILKSLNYIKPVMLQSMLIFKQPHIGGKVAPHQDNTFLYTQPLSTIGFWFPLEDATKDNGCLWYIPGSHLWRIERKFKRNPEYFEDSSLRGCKGKQGQKATVFEYSSGYSALPEDDDKYVPVEVKAGSCVLIHGSVVHKSHANVSGKSRFAYAFHVIEGSYEYPKENWLQMNDNGEFDCMYNDAHSELPNVLPF